MASDLQVRQKENELHRLRQDLARESAKTGPAHAKASKARADASRTSSESTRGAKRAEAACEDKKASDAEQARARAKGRIATKEMERAAARRKYEADLAAIRLGPWQNGVKPSRPEKRGSEVARGRLHPRLRGRPQSCGETCSSPTRARTRTRLRARSRRRWGVRHQSLA